MPAPIIVVHQQTKVLDMILSALRSAGYEAAGFNDPVTALDAIETDSRVKVLVTRIDLGTGKLNGIALARMLHHNARRDIKVIFVGRDANRQFVDSDAGEFLPHPIDPSVLLDAVRRKLAE